MWNISGLCERNGFLFVLTREFLRSEDIWPIARLWFSCLCVQTWFLVSRSELPLSNHYLSDFPVEDKKIRHACSPPHSVRSEDTPLQVQICLLLTSLLTLLLCLSLCVFSLRCPEREKRNVNGFQSKRCCGVVPEKGKIHSFVYLEHAVNVKLCLGFASVQH